jgi:hypothetical protein
MREAVRCNKSNWDIDLWGDLHWERHTVLVSRDGLEFLTVNQPLNFARIDLGIDVVRVLGGSVSLCSSSSKV